MAVLSLLGITAPVVGLMLRQLLMKMTRSPEPYCLVADAAFPSYGLYANKIRVPPKDGVTTEHR